MAKEKKDSGDNNKILKYRRRFHINIGIVVFAFVLIYFLVYLIQFLSATHVTIYEVQKGKIMVNDQFTGLVLRSEEVTYSPEDGGLNYYSKEGEKAGYGDLICSIDREGSLSAEITAAGTDGSSLTMSDLVEVQDLIRDYANDYSEDQFYNVYSFGNSLNANVQESLYLAALEDLGDRTNIGTFSLITAQRDGILAFYTDGYENVTPDNFTADLYLASDYKKTNLNGNTTAVTGQALYKTVTDENWTMLIPLDEESSLYYQEVKGQYNDEFLIKVTFKKDDTQTYATARIQTYDGQDFLLLSFNSSMIRYISDRYLEVELGSDEDTGLKIPNSAIVEKEFYVIPSEYIVNDESSGTGVIRIYDDKQGTHHEEFLAADIYYVDERTGDYCFWAEDLEVGDTLQAPESTSRLIINNTTAHDGVYNVNKGYAVFKLIEPISTNGEYTIVETGTAFGLSQYDRIVLNGEAISEGMYAN